MLNLYTTWKNFISGIKRARLWSTPRAKEDPGGAHKRPILRIMIRVAISWRKMARWKFNPRRMTHFPSIKRLAHDKAAHHQKSAGLLVEWLPTCGEAHRTDTSKTHTAMKEKKRKCFREFVNFEGANAPLGGGNVQISRRRRNDATLVSLCARVFVGAVHFWPCCVITEERGA